MNKTLVSLSAAILVALTGTAQAASPDVSDSLRSQVAKSELVFVGNVIDVAYAPSQGVGTARGVPHTFVTYEIERVLQGQAQSKEVTLRFIGGRGEKAAFLAVSGQPMFDLGDRDVLMVAGNGTSGCPLVGCADGRYRLIQDMVFSEEGQAIEADGKGGINKAGFYDLEEVTTHRVSQTTFRLVDRFDAGESRVPFDGASSGAQMAESSFVEQIEQAARAVGNATPGTFRNAAIDAPFSLNMEAEAAPAVADDASKAERGTPEDLAEATALRANDGNPVLDQNQDQR
jgi:hypothetical protein